MRTLTVLPVLLAAPSTAFAWAGGLLDLSLSSGAGYDSNVFMDYEASTSPGVISSGFGHAAPGLGLRIRSGLLDIDLPVEGSFKFYSSSDAGLSYAWYTRPTLGVAWGPFSASAGYAMDGYAITGFGEDANTFYGGAASVDYRPWSALSLRATYEGGQRNFSERWLAGIGDHQSNIEHRAGVSARATLFDRFDLRPGYAFESIDSNSDEFDIMAHEGSLRLSWTPLTGLSIQPFFRAKFRRYSKSARDDRLFSEGAEIAYRFGEWIALAVQYARGDNLSSDPAGSYSRNLGMLSLEITYSVGLWKEGAAPRSAAAVMPVLSGKTVTFFYRSDTARSVAVTGSFNGWVRPGVPMDRAGEGGLWKVGVPLPPGSHEYCFIVDGVAAPPQESPQLVEDGFGGANGLMVVE